MRYFFHIREGEELIEDPSGQRFASQDEARQEAIRAAREIMAERLVAGRPLDGSTFEIRDEGGHLLMRLPFKDAIPPD